MINIPFAIWQCTSLVSEYDVRSRVHTKFVLEFSSSIPLHQYVLLRARNLKTIFRTATNYCTCVCVSTIAIAVTIYLYLRDRNIITWHHTGSVIDTSIAVRAVVTCSVGCRDIP